MKKKFVEFLKVFPLPWDYIFYLLNIKNMMQINDNKNIDNIMKVLIAFFGTLYMLEFLVTKITELHITDIFHGEQVILFFIYMVLPISIIYSIVVYIIIYKESSSLSNLIALFIQVVKFFTIALIFIGLIIVIVINALIMDDINILASKEDFNLIHNYYFLVMMLLSLFVTFIFLIVIPTKNFLHDKGIRNHKIFLIFIICIVPYLNHSLGSFDILPKISISNLLDKENFCREISEIKIMKNDSCESNKSKILEFRTNCINSI
ncbi:hypothetical protein ACN5O8_07010 [Aliarcobacter butzleri]|uniref:hypothetical protein n=1 Tax=Aliarcobacter butzleri TaxID=28197 RepID=UPI003AF885CB